MKKKSYLRLISQRRYKKFDFKQILTSLCVLLALSGLNGCKKFVEVPPPQTKLVTANVFNNNASATAALTNIYTLMYTNRESFNMAFNMGLYADELKNYSTNVSQIQMYTNALVSTGRVGPWANGYLYIYDANAVITGLQTTTGCSIAVKQQLTGEGYFIRAFWHFFITNTYGDAPVVLTTNYQTNGSISRAPRVAVLQQVISDLQNAQKLLNDNYVDGTDTVITAEKVRPNKAAATALLARSYLYLADYAGQNLAYYQKADSAATVVINNGKYSLSTLNAVFLKNSSEAIWQLQTVSPTTFDTPDGNYFILTGAPQSGALNQSATISQQLQNSFEPNDQRKTNWLGSYTTITAPINTYYYPYKYKGNSINFSASSIKEYVMVLRLAEQYLIRAEARVHEGDLIGAAADLNAIRSRAGLPAATANTQSTLLAAIQHERQVEFFCEWGHRWFDENRTGNAASLMAITTPQKGGSWNNDNHQLLFPIGVLDINADPNLTQNPGY
jgi:hypothetical protein